MKTICDTKVCRECGKEYSKKECKRVYGKESKTYLLGFCSAVCYTNKFHPTSKETNQ